jgi:Fur family transcriptional regulator, zinc uptake regulator
MNAPNVSPMTANLNNVQARLVSARVLCEQHGARFTPMRARVLEVLLRHNRFVTAYELLNSILKTHPRANAATVYRILGFLMEKGLAHRLAMVSGYVACNQVPCNGYRLFAICTHCGTVAELEGNDVREMLAAQAARVGCALEEGAAEVRVVCRDCQ